MFSLMRKRNIYQLPPVCNLTRNQTHNILVYGTTLQPTEPLGQGKNTMHHQRVRTVGLPADETGATAGGAGQGHRGWAETHSCAHHTLATHSSFQGAQIHALGP